MKFMKKNKMEWYKFPSVTKTLQISSENQKAHFANQMANELVWWCCGKLTQAHTDTYKPRTNEKKTPKIERENEKNGKKLFYSRIEIYENLN